MYFTKCNAVHLPASERQIIIEAIYSPTFCDWNSSVPGATYKQAGVNRLGLFPAYKF